MAVPEDIQQLVAAVPAPPGESLPRGASDEDIRGFSIRTGVSVPSVLGEWLKFTNAPCVGPGGMYGICPERKHQDIEGVYLDHPEWQSRNWIPIAGDGCGNEYVLAAEGGLGASNPVFFFEHEQSGSIAGGVRCGFGPLAFPAISAPARAWRAWLAI
jgi:hypothetical protein